MDLKLFERIAKQKASLIYATDFSSDRGGGYEYVP